VDDEGVDLFFHRRDSARTLAVQVKSRMSDSKRLLSGTFIAFVRDQTFAPRPDLDMLFVAVDVPTGAYTAAWLVPSEDFAAGTTVNGQGRRRLDVLTLSCPRVEMMHAAATRCSTALPMRPASALLLR
jgi:hypothetical protein